jgi:hypothetical protein
MEVFIPPLVQISPTLLCSSIGYGVGYILEVCMTCAVFLYVSAVDSLAVPSWPRGVYMDATPRMHVFSGCTHQWRHLRLGAPLASVLNPTSSNPGPAEHCFWQVNYMYIYIFSGPCSALDFDMFIACLWRPDGYEARSIQSVHWVGLLPTVVMYIYVYCAPK